MEAKLDNFYGHLKKMYSSYMEPLMPKYVNDLVAEQFESFDEEVVTRRFALGVELPLYLIQRQPGLYNELEQYYKLSDEERHRLVLETLEDCEEKAKLLLNMIQELKNRSEEFCTDTRNLCGYVVLVTRIRKGLLQKH